VKGLKNEGRGIEDLRREVASLIYSLRNQILVCLNEIPIRCNEIGKGSRLALPYDSINQRRILRLLPRTLLIPTQPSGRATRMP